jgi:hypothetical protein
MTRNLTCLVLMICLGCPVFAQKAKETQKAKEAQNAKDAQVKKMLQDAANKGPAVPVKNLSVNDNVRAQAVLIPQVDARRIFGKEIANNYAVIQLVVGNKSNDASLIIHSIFIDYSHWALSGSEGPFDENDKVVKDRDKPFQTATNPHHIASEEYRIVRGQLLDAQNWTWRNVTLRALTLAGSLAGAGAFAFNKNENKLISNLNGNLPSGFATLIPDPTIEQLKRVDDFGYHTNKLVPQHDSEIIICFFPIDRFLTPGFRRLYLKSPALFFAPLQMLVDTKIRGDVEAVLGRDFGTGVPLSDLTKALPCYLQVKKYLLEHPETGKSSANSAQVQTKSNASPSDQKKPSEKEQSAPPLLPDMDKYGYEDCLRKFGFVNDPQSPDGALKLNTSDTVSMEKFKLFEILEYLAATSLNKVTVVVDGVMAVDTSGIAAKIDGVDFDPVTNCGDDHTPCFWTDLAVEGGVRKGKIRGSYLTGGQIKIKESEGLKITDIQTISDGSSDQVLHFSFKLTQAIDAQKKLTFIVSKPAAGSAAANASKTTDSSPFEYTVDFTTKGPNITSVELDKNENTLTIIGKELIDAPPTNALVVTLHTSADEDVEVKPKSPLNGTKIVIDIPADKKVAGCWSVKVKVGDKDSTGDSAESDSSTFAISPSPTFESAKVEGGQITVTGTDLIDTQELCDKGKKLSFQLVRAGSQPLALEPQDSSSSTEWTFAVPTGASKIEKAPYKVKLLLDNKEVATRDLEQPDKSKKPKKSQ